MKLWYQSLSHRAQANPYGVALARILASVADPDTTIHMQGVERSAGIGQHYRLLEHHDTSEVIENALRAQQQGFDAFLIGNISDAGIHEAREQVAIPVLGMGETCMHLACMMGARFGLVAISERWIPRLGENVRRYGLERHLAGIESMRTSPVDLKKGLADPHHRTNLLGQFTSAAARLLDRGAEVIIPAGGEVVVFTVEAGMYEIEGAPVGAVMPSMTESTLFDVYADGARPLGRPTIEVADAEPPANTLAIEAPQLAVTDLKIVPRPFRADELSPQ